MSKREFPKLNKDNFVAWKSLMKFHLGSIGDYAQTSIIVDHTDIVGLLTTEDLSKKKEHNQAMLEIAFAHSYDEYDDIKGCRQSYQQSMEEIRMYKEPKEKASEESLMI